MYKLCSLSHIFAEVRCVWAVKKFVSFSNSSVSCNIKWEQPPLSMLARFEHNSISTIRMQVRYLPSQVDATASTAALPYTASPFALLWDDSLLFLRHILRVPGIIWPLHPWGSGALDELYPSWQNLVEITLHTVLIILQLLFLVSLPLCLFYPLFAVAAYVGTFLLLNRLICLALNGRQKFLTSNVNLDHLPKHAEERWIFVNGVAVGYIHLSRPHPEPS